jgi:hypothetical protein
MQILSELDEVLSNDIVDRSSFFQLKHFIVGKEYTTQGKMWQCLRELRSRKSFIEQYIVEIEESNDRIELLNIDKDKNSLLLTELLATERNDNLRKLATRETSVKVRQINRQIAAITAHKKNLEQKINDYVEESRFYMTEFRSLEAIEPLKPLDDVDAQKEYWTARLFQEINLKMLLNQPLNAETIKMILSLNDDSPLKQQVVQMLDGNRKAIQAMADRLD